MKKLWFVIIPVAVALAAFLYFRERNANGAPEAKIETVEARRGNIEVKVLSTGTVEPYTRVEVSSPVNGRIDRVMVDEGDRVKQGDVLAWISSEDRIALLDAARSALESAQEANDAEAIKAAKEEYQIADKAYKPVPLTNSIRGEVISRTCEPGQNVSTQTALFAIADRLVATVNVDEADIGKIKDGLKAWVVLDAFPNERVDARVTKISKEGKLVSDVVEYDVMVEPVHVPAHWASGMTANVEFAVESKDNVLMIPRSALVEESGREFVTMAMAVGLPGGGRPGGVRPSGVRAGGGRPGGGHPGAGHSVRREIKTGITDGKMIEVLEGLKEGDRIVLSNASAQAEGQSGGSGNRRRMGMMMGGPH